MSPFRRFKKKLHFRTRSQDTSSLATASLASAPDDQAEARTRDVLASCKQPLRDRLDAPVSVAILTLTLDPTGSHEKQQAVASLPLTGLSQAQENQRKLEQLKEEQEKEACLRALGYSDYRQHKTRNPLRVPGTCRWVLENDRFLEWRNSQRGTPGLLWVSADPGCGKSVLARSLIDQELLHSAKTSVPTVCYFFFKYGITEQQGAAACMAVVLRQIFQRQPFLVKHAVPEYRRIGLNVAESFEALWEIFLAVTSDPDTFDTICLLDALDECDEVSRFALIDALKELYSTDDPTTESKSRLKFLVTSRPYEEIDRRFRTLTNVFPTIRLKGEEESKIISQEINLVIRAVIPQIALELNLPSTVESTLLDRLLSIPNRTYLWLHLILDEIRKSLGASTPQRMLKIVETLPETVDAAYESILDRSTDPVLAKRLLHILTAATRDLSLNELNIALHIKHGMYDIEALDLEDNKFFQITVRNLCGLFINVIESKVYFIHQTAREYLVASDDTKDQPKGSWRRSLDPTISHAILAECCIIYLHFRVFENQRPPDLPNSCPKHFLDSDGNHLSRQIRRFTLPLDTDRYYFLNYAALNWTFHYEEGIGESCIADMAFTLCNPESKHFLSWFNIFRTEGNFIAGSDVFPVSCNHLMIACAFGFPAMVERLVPDVDRMDQIDQIVDHLSPLSLAVWSGCHQVVNILLKTRPELYYQDATYIRSSPLCLAVEQGDLETVKMLLECGFPANQAVRNKAPLERIAQSIHDEDRLKILMFLLEHGADQNPRDRPSALQWAAEHDDVQTVSILVNHDSDVNHSISSSDKGIPPPALCSAAKHGSIPMMRVLLDAEADVNIEDTRNGPHGPTPLYNAVKNEQQLAVSLLLCQDGIKVDAGEGFYGTPLLCAIQSGNTHFMQLLLKAGADPNLGRYNDSPLVLASGRSNSSAATMLLSFGAKVNPGDGANKTDGITPLGAATRAGNLNTVKILLEHGADITVTWSEGRKSAFSSAAEGDHLHIMRFLLEHDSGQLQQLAPLALSAALTGSPDMLDLVLSYTSSTVLESFSAESQKLFEITKNNYLHIMCLLLEKGGCDAKDVLSNAFRTALDGTADMLQLVLNHYPGISLGLLNEGLRYLAKAPERAYRETFEGLNGGEADYDGRLKKYKARVKEIEGSRAMLREKRRELGHLSSLSVEPEVRAELRPSIAVGQDE